MSALAAAFLLSRPLKLLACPNPAHACCTFVQVIGLGQLGGQGSGQLRIVAKQSKLKISAKNAKRAKAGGGYSSSASGMQTAGATTSLAFTPVQVC